MSCDAAIELVTCSGLAPLARSVTVTTWKAKRLEQKRIRARFGLTMYRHERNEDVTDNYSSTRQNRKSL